MEKLTNEDVETLKEIGLEPVVFFAVVNPDDRKPIAMFEYKEWAEDWKKQYCDTCEIERYNFVEKNQTL